MPDFFPTSAADGTFLKDDFLTNSAVADATVGDLDWELTAIANASTITYVASQNGIIRDTTAGVANGDGQAYTLHPDGLVLAGTDQLFRFRVAYPNVAGNQIAGHNFRLGISDSVTATAGVVGVYVESLAGVVTLHGRSANGNKSAAAVGVPGFTGGTTMVFGTTYNFEVRMEGTNANGGPDTLTLFVNGEKAAQIENFLIGSAETCECSMVHWQTTGGAITLELDVDYIEFWLPRN